MSKAFHNSKYVFVVILPLSIHYTSPSSIIAIFFTICFHDSSTTICWIVISQTLKHVQDMFNFNMISNPRGYLVLFVSKTPSVVWYFIMDLIPPKVRSYFTLFESKSTVIFICIHCLIISFKLHKFTWNLCGVFPSSNLNSYIVFH